MQVFLKDFLKTVRKKRHKKRHKKRTKNADLSTFSVLLQQMTGVEPASPAWEAGVLPMNYICTWHIKNYTAVDLKLQDFFMFTPRSSSQSARFRALPENGSSG